MRMVDLRFVVTLGCLAVAALATAQEPVGRSAYQTGAGAYFAGRTDEAEKHLTQAIGESPDDPRGYYLRGLNRLRSGDRQGAQADLAKGSELEARMGTSSPLVDQSLAAVQGSSRLTLERIRRAARDAAEVNARQQVMAKTKQQREARERVVLRSNYELPMEALASRLSIDQARQVAGKPAAGGSTAARSPAGDPFADDATNEASAFAATPAPVLDPAATNPVTTSASGADGVPEEARGSMKASSLFGVFSRSTTGAGQAYIADKASALVGSLPPGALPPGVGPPGMAPPGMGPGGPPQEFAPAEPPAGAPATDDPFNAGEGDPFEADAASPFDEAESETPMMEDSSESSSASPFDVGP
ncbi:hypothetical protein [Aeoliella sp. SH292]|uniref:hypothetical protein n=1 Tax=Aeoliella sp. SH292 TaxID=3454464 RepID=UPI003F9CCA2C